MEIDWSKPVYLHGEHVPLTHDGSYGRGPRAFHCFIDPFNPKSRLYYNENDRPFAMGHAAARNDVSNIPGHHPDQSNLALPDPEQDALEGNPLWASF